MIDKQHNQNKQHKQTKQHKQIRPQPAARKRYQPGLTVKRMRDKRFRRTEEAILKAMLKKGEDASVRTVVAQAGVARSTFYHHHKTVGVIIRDHRNLVLDEYGRAVRKLLIVKNTPVRKIYSVTLMFVLREKRTFRMLLQNNERIIFVQMMRRLEPKLRRITGLTEGRGNKAYQVYRGEIISLFDRWCMNGFREGELVKVLDDIMYLTVDADKRLERFMG